jgi:hypothetical protein
MKIKNTVLGLIASAASVAAADAIAPSGDSSGSSDVAAIQSAIDAAGNGGSVELGSGIFYIDTQLMVTNGVTLAGQGWDNTIIKQVASTPSEYTRVATVSGGAKVEHVTLTGGRVTGTNYKFGGGAFVDGGTVSWCCITNNSLYSANVRFGGGVGFYQGGGTVDHCIVADNSVSTTSVGDVGGGGIGGYYPTGAITIDSCLVFGNRSTHNSSSGRGGGIGFDFVNQSATVTVRNTTIVGNSAGEGQNASHGGAVFTANDSKNKFSMVNCIIVGNTTAGASTTVYLNYTGGVDYCFFDIEDDLLGDNSQTGDPKFANAAAGDFAIASDSPAKGAGTTYSGIGSDLAGVDFENPPSMGCYEYSNRAAAPAFEPASGTRFYPSANVTISCATEGASIYYTLDGSDPTDSSSLYDGPIVLEATTTIKARAYMQDMDPSAVVSATYVYKAPVPKPDGFSKYVEITLATNLAANAITTGIPALVKLSESTISGFDYDDFIFANGGDMMFCDENGSPIPHEVDTWDVDGESLVWVKLPSTAENTTITMYYGSIAASSEDPADVWTGYTGVWHFEEATADTAANSYGMYANSTATDGIDGHIAQHTKTNEVGRFGKGFRTNDSTGWKAGNYNYGGVWVNDTGANSPIDGGENFTISGWFKHDQLDYYWDHLFYKRSRSDNGTSGAYVNAFAIESNSGTGSNPQICPRGSSDKGKALLSENQGLQNKWAYITFVYDGAVVRVFKNGIETDWTAIDACIDNDAPLVFGNNCNVAFGTMGDAAWNGWIDEVRFSKGSKDAAWVAAEYAAMNAGAADIFSYGDAQDTGDTPPAPAPIVIGEVSARPGTDYSGSVVTLSFTGDIPEGATASASLTIGDAIYVGVIDSENGVVTFEVPAADAAAGEIYEGTATLSVNGVIRTTDVELVQGAPGIDEDEDWINETAETFGSTGVWSGDVAEVADGSIAVSNATFTAGTAAPKDSVVMISTTFCFGDCTDESLDVSARAGIAAVEVGGVSRYAFLTANGVVTNLTVAANISTPVEVTLVLDCVESTVSYTVGGVSLGTHPMTAKNTGVSSVSYLGEGEVASLEGAYRCEVLDTNVAQAGGVEYQTVAEAIASGETPVALLWDASWNPTAVGSYVITTNGHALAIGGTLAWLVTDNGNGTITVAVSSGEIPQPVIGSRTGSDELVGLSVVKGEGDDDTMYLVIPFAAKAGFTYTLRSSASLLAPTSEWSAAAGVEPISLTADGDAEFRAPMNGTAAFYVISVE